MQTITYQAMGQVALIDRSPPEPGPGDVLIAVRASGICHTDIDVLYARYGSGAFPVIPGHEYAGEITAIGRDVSGWAIGDRVVVDPNIGCGTCRACRRGRTNLCDDLGAFGVTRDGGFAAYSVVQARNLHRIDDLDFSVAALAEPMGCALNGVSALDPREEDETLIFGAGPIGLLIGVALKARGLSRIAFVDIDPARLELARDFGFTGVEPGSAELTGRRHGMDLTVDATGKVAVANALVDYTASGGTCLFFGVCAPEARIEVSPFEIFRRQLSLLGTHSLNHNIPDALAALRKIGPRISRLVSHRVSLEEAATILSDGPPARSLKIQAVDL